MMWIIGCNLALKVVSLLDLPPPLPWHLYQESLSLASCTHSKGLAYPFWPQNFPVSH